jgi:hypothetical protein
MAPQAGLVPSATRVARRLKTAWGAGVFQRSNRRILMFMSGMTESPAIAAFLEKFYTRTAALDASPHPDGFRKAAARGAAVGDGAKASSAARDLIRFLTAPSALPVISAKGMKRPLK